MKIKNDAIKAVGINLISNLIFQIILFFLSGSGIVYAMGKICQSLKDSRVTLSVLDVVIFGFSCVAVGIVGIFLCKSIIDRFRGRRESELFEKEQDYYFSDYEKQLTIYKNGHGIITHKFHVITNDVDKLRQIRRRLNIEDGAEASNFPSLDAMMKTDKGKRLSDFGFWYKSEDNIITDVQEYYWNSGMPNEDNRIRNNPKEIRWLFKLDSSRLQKGKSYEICYIISVPGLAALENGRLNKELANDKSQDRSFSSMQVDRRIKKLRYIISFEEGISLENIPVCKRIISEQDRAKEVDIQGVRDYNLFYTKFIFEMDNPEFGSNVRVSWKYNTI